VEESAAHSTADRAWLWLLALAFAVRLPFVWIAPNNGTDALTRFEYTLDWLKAPNLLPVATSEHHWLPLHFWLLGAVLSVWHSERSARLLTVLLGALTILPFWGIVRRVFDRGVALASALAFALFSYHIAYSVTTSSEAPTLFLLACAVYYWLLFFLADEWRWCVPAAIALSAASLIRFDAWIYVAALSLLLLDFSSLRALLSNRAAWLRALVFGLIASGGAFGWMIYSELRWGDWMELPHRNVVALRSILPILRHGLPFRMIVIPVSLLAALNLLAVLAALGIVWVLARGGPDARRLAVLAGSLLAWSYFNSVYHELTEARYTLMYDWLLIPFAFEALRRLAERWPRGWPDRKLYATALVLFVACEGASAVAGHYGPAEVADRLGPMSPGLEPHIETRGLTRWLRQNVRPSDTVVMDDFGYQSDTIVHLAGIDPSRAYQLDTAAYSNPQVLDQEVTAFIRARHPQFAVCSPYGPIAALWSLDDHDQAEVPVLGISLSMEWHGPHWSVYRIRYETAALPGQPE
jgi:4-amino-4-deoxy-L-arabinose transferase-like glycosyltransferase